MAEQKTYRAFSLKPWLRLIPVTKRAWPAFWLSVISNVLLAFIDFYLPLYQSRVVDDYIAKGSLEGFGGYIALYAVIGVVQLILIVLYFRGCMHCEALSCGDHEKRSYILPVQADRLGKRCALSLVFTCDGSEICVGETYIVDAE